MVELKNIHLFREFRIELGFCASQSIIQDFNGDNVVGLSSYLVQTLEGQQQDRLARRRIAHWLIAPSGPFAICPTWS